jgi:hypothetical protein
MKNFWKKSLKTNEKESVMRLDSHEYHLSHLHMSKKTNFNLMTLLIVIILDVVVATGVIIGFVISGNINERVDIIRKEQDARTEIIYMKTKDRIYRSEIEEWLENNREGFEKAGIQAEIPKSPRPIFSDEGIIEHAKEILRNSKEEKK